MQTKERIKAEILDYIIHDYKTAKEGDISFHEKIEFPQETQANLESIKSELLSLIDKESTGELKSILALVGEDSNLDNLINFNRQARGSQILQDLLSDDNGENASDLAELANEKVHEEYEELVSQAKDDAEELDELVKS